MTWIKTISFANADGPLRKLYSRVTGPDNNVDNIMLAHSLRPHTMEGHMALYKHVLHHPRNRVEKWFLEVIGVYTSLLNRCTYCVEHHFTGMARLLADDDRAAAMRRALESGNLAAEFSDRESSALDYARKLTEGPASIREDDIAKLRNAGWEDGEILEINQVTAYFSYANRMVLGLGVGVEGDVLGLSPSSGDGGWQHR